jgi:hypothetical protein
MVEAVWEEAKMLGLGNPNNTPHPLYRDSVMVVRWALWAN